MNKLNWKVLSFIFLTTSMFITIQLHAADVGVVNPKAIGVPLVSVLAAPEKFKGVCIRIYGILVEDNLNFVLWGSSENADMGDLSSLIRIDFDFDVLKGTQKDVTKLSGAYVLIEGVLDYQTGKNGQILYPLEIKHVERIGFRGRPLRRDELLKKLEREFLSQP